MRKATWSVIIMVGLFLISCTSGQRNIIVGSWIDENSQIELKFDADGNYFEIEENKIDHAGTWKMSEKEPWMLSLYEDGELEVEIGVKFIGNNEMEFKVDDEILKLKRK